LGPLALLGVLLYLAFMALRGVGALLDWAGVRVFGEFLKMLAPWVGWVVLAMSAPMLVIMLVSSFSALIRKKTDSPGADDNGSGTALVLEVARRLSEKPPRNVEVFFAWWGAEERGLFGSRQFVRRFHHQLDRDSFYLINTDCVGVGERLTVHTGQGVLRRRATDPATVKRIERIAAQRNVPTVRSWESIISGGSSDHAGWAERGYRHAVSFLRENPYPISPPARILAALLRIPDANQLQLDHIHTVDDTLDGIDPRVLDETTDLVEMYVREVDRELDARFPQGMV
jgi:Zn-dependent M28 family amino/carboxypeptidase